MTRPTKRDIERRLASLGGGPSEIVMTDFVVERVPADPDDDRERWQRTRVWRDERGEWRSEREDL